jgi:hypothetical protein
MCIGGEVFGAADPSCVEGVSDAATVGACDIAKAAPNQMSEPILKLDANHMPGTRTSR